jgi:hypothetical protein
MRAITTLGLLAAMSGIARAQGVTPPPTARPAHSFALVIGNNMPPHDGLPRLRYADDDAVRWAVLFDALGADFEVLTELDAESAHLYGPLAFRPGPPSREALRSAVGRLATRVAAAHAHGERAVFYFVYAGHGDVEDGRGYLALTDGRFTRSDLDSVLAPVGADTNHVIIDACRATSFLGNRGPGGERRPWQDAYFAPNAPRLARTGFLLASSANGLSHEWEEFQAGVFSHEVRSGLMGAADANGDGLVSYTELTGFVRLANLPVNNERYRPSIVSRTPAGDDGVLLDLHAARAGSLTLAPPPPGVAHELLEDHAGVRWADFHPSPAGRVRLILPRPSWSTDGFYLRSLADDGEYAVPAGRDVTLRDLEARPSRAQRRGALNDAFTHLFDLPFDAAALEIVTLDVDVRAEASPTAPATSRATKIAGVSALAAGGASLGAAAGFFAAAVGAQRDAQNAPNGVERARYNDEIDARNRWATITAVGGGVLAALGIGLLIWHRHRLTDQTLGLW